MGKSAVLRFGRNGRPHLRAYHEQERPLSYKRLVGFALEHSARAESGLQNAANFSKIAARYVPGNESDFRQKIADSGKEFARWGLAVLGEVAHPEDVPFLVEYLASTDSALAEVAYTSLQKITGLDPVWSSTAASMTRRSWRVQRVLPPKSQSAVTGHRSHSGPRARTPFDRG
jgi:hypothetical protein